MPKNSLHTQEEVRVLQYTKEGADKTIMKIRQTKRLAEWNYNLPYYMVAQDRYLLKKTNILIDKLRNPCNHSTLFVYVYRVGTMCKNYSW